MLTLIGVWLVWRGRPPVLAYGVLVTGASLVVLSMVAQRALILPSRAWMGLAHALGWVSTRLILAVVFFAIVTPIGFVKRRLGWDPLRRRSGPKPTYWHPYGRRQRDPKHFEKMY